MMSRPYRYFVATVLFVTIAMFSILMVYPRTRTLSDTSIREQNTVDGAYINSHLLYVLDTALLKWVSQDAV